LVLAPGCGRKGPPLPPLVRVPAAPPDFAAQRRGNTVEIAFTVPSANTDNTRPANIERVDVYGYSGPSTISNEDLVRLGERIGAVEVKAPRDPDRTIDPDDPAADLDPPEGPGIDQGGATNVFEELTADAFASAASLADPAPVEEGRPLMGPAVPVPFRTFLGVGVSTRGRRGDFSQRATIPLIPAPPPPSQAKIAYDESGVTVAWTPPAGGRAQEPGSVDVLLSRPFGIVVPVAGYHVYEVGSGQFETRLTEDPVTAPQFVDRRIEWGAERCYTVRTVLTVGLLSVESEPVAPTCEKLTDTFPPAAPKGLVVVPSEAAINLIWDPNTEKDLAGYIVLRAPGAARTFTPVTPEPVQGTTLVDKVEPGTPFVYAVQAVDTAGNKSVRSAESTPEAAR
jgi:hypothetical protein